MDISFKYGETRRKTKKWIFWWKKNLKDQNYKKINKNKKSKYKKILKLKSI